MHVVNERGIRAHGKSQNFASLKTTESNKNRHGLGRTAVELQIAAPCRFVAQVLLLSGLASGPQTV